MGLRQASSLARLWKECLVEPGPQCEGPQDTMHLGVGGKRAEHLGDPREAVGREGGLRPGLCFSRWGPQTTAWADLWVSQHGVGLSEGAWQSPVLTSFLQQNASQVSCPGLLGPALTQLLWPSELSEMGFT